MIRHIVLLKVKPDAAQEQVDEAISAAQRLPAAIPEISATSVGKNFAVRDETYSHAIVSDFRSIEDLNTYSAHPAHIALATLLRPLIEKLNFVDYEF